MTNLFNIPEDWHRFCFGITSDALTLGEKGNGMEVLVYANPIDVSKEHFFQQISKVPSISPKFVLERDHFKSLVMQKVVERRALVFFAYDQDDLNAAVSVKEYMAGTRVILILHKINAATVNQGLSISPCIITYAKRDFSDIVAVLEKFATLEE